MLVLVNWKSLSFSVPKFCNEVSLRADTSLVTFLQSAKLPMCNVNIRNIPISNCFFFSRSHTLSKITACLLQTQIVYYYSVIWKKNESFCTAAKKLAEKVQLLLEIVLETSLGFVERELPNVTKKTRNPEFFTRILCTLHFGSITYDIEQIRAHLYALNRPEFWKIIWILPSFF